MAAKLDHVNIIRGIDVGKEGNTHYFAMEFVEGESVADKMKRNGALPRGGGSPDAGRQRHVERRDGVLPLALAAHGTTRPTPSAARDARDAADGGPAAGAKTTEGPSSEIPKEGPLCRLPREPRRRLL
jgi:hypothetical protein